VLVLLQLVLIYCCPDCLLEHLKILLVLLFKVLNCLFLFGNSLDFVNELSLSLFGSFSLLLLNELNQGWFLVFLKGVQF
jgi:hypothetical protein